MDTVKYDYNIKEASVVLEKLSDDDLLMMSPRKSMQVINNNSVEDGTIKECPKEQDDAPQILKSYINENTDTKSTIETQISGRKRKRKNDAPKRKIVVLEPSVLDKDYDDEYSIVEWSTSTDNGNWTKVNETDEGYMLYTKETLCGNNNAKSAPGFTNKANEASCSYNKHSRNPYYQNQNSQASDGKKVVETIECETSDKEEVTSSCRQSTSRVDDNKSAVNEMYKLRKKNIKRIPLILNRKKKSTSSVTNFQIHTTRNSLTNTLGKHAKEKPNTWETLTSPIQRYNLMTSPNRVPTTLPVSLPPLCTSSVKTKSGVINKQTSKEDTNTCSSTENDGQMSPLGSSASTPLTVSQCARSSSVFSEVLPDSRDIKAITPKPRYSNRLTSKPGTKYIVRKDSIISANLEELVEPPCSSWSNDDSGSSHLILKLPDACIDEKQFYDNFVKKSDSSESSVTQGKASYENYEPSTSALSYANTISSQSVTTSSFLTYSNALELTNVPAKRKIDTTKRNAGLVPIVLHGRGTLEDIKQEMSKTNPDLWKTQETVPGTSSDVKTGVQKSRMRKAISVQDTSPAGLFLDNLKNRLMDKSKIFTNVIRNLPKVNEFEAKRENDKEASEADASYNGGIGEVVVDTSHAVGLDTDATDKTREIDSDCSITLKKDEWSSKDKKTLVKKEQHAQHKKQMIVIRYGGRQTSINDMTSVENKEKLEQLIKQVNTERAERLQPTINQQRTITQNHSESMSSLKTKYSDSKDIDVCSLSSDVDTTPKDASCISPIKIKEEPMDYHQLKNDAFKSPENKSEKAKTGQSINDHAYTRSETGKNIPVNPSNLSVSSSPHVSPIPVYAVRYGQKMILFPTSKTVNIKPTTSHPMLPGKDTRETPTKAVKKYKHILMKDSRDRTVVKHCNLVDSTDLKQKTPDTGIDKLVPVNFNTIIPKRPKNQIKHMCSIVVQINRSENNEFSFTKNILALSFTNGSNPDLVRWHEDGIHVALITFNNYGRIQHMTVDHISPGFYSLSLKGHPKVRRNRTFDGLLTSSLPNEELMTTETDFLAIGPIKGIMDPTLKKPEVTNCSGLTLTQVFQDVLPKDLKLVYNPMISDRSYKPKVHDKAWYSTEKFDIFTRTYGRTRGYHAFSGPRLPEIPS